MKLKINVSENATVPTRATKSAAGFDLYAAQKGTVKPRDRMMIDTGIKLEIEPGYEAQIRPRSGLALKYGITVLNSPGTIDADYRGSVGVVLYNSDSLPFEVNVGDRIAQMVIQKVPEVEVVMSDSLSGTDRGDGGFGSTGK